MRVNAKGDSLEALMGLFASVQSQDSTHSVRRPSEFPRVYESMFTRTPVDVIKGLRKPKQGATSFLTSVFTEIKEEVKSTDMVVKCNAIQKLFVLYLEGYEMEWAAFHIIELMSSPKFSQKRYGYLSCEQCFGSNPELLLLTTNLFRKDLSGANYLDTTIALNTLSMVCTTDLAHSLADEVLTLLNNSKPILRKKATALFCKIYYYIPEYLAQSIERIAEKLRDDNPSVALNAVNTLFEQARRTPQAVLYTASSLYDLLRSTRSNWMLIKLIKLVPPTQFSLLCRIEPRLLRKLAEPLEALFTNCSAKSVEFELILFTLTWYCDQPSLKHTALTRLLTFIESPDANCNLSSVKYLGLKGLQLAFERKAVSIEDYKSYITESLQYKDMTIRKQSLHLLVTTTTEETVTEAVTSILREASNPDCAEIKESLVASVLFLLGRNHYELVSDFRWMFEVLCLLVRGKTEQHEGDIAGIMLDVVARVEGLGEEAVTLAVDMLRSLEEWKSEKSSALASLIFIIGENGISSSPELRLEALTLLTCLRVKELRLSESIHSAIVCAAFKLYLSVLDLASESLTAQVVGLFTEIPSADSVEPRDRAKLYLKVINAMDRDALMEAAKRLESLQPVNPQAQAMIKCPEQLLVAVEVDPAELRREREDGTFEYFYFREEDFTTKDAAKEAKKKLKADLSQKSAQDPFYVKPVISTQSKKKKKGKKPPKEDAPEEPKPEEPQDPLSVPGLPKADTTKKYKVNREQPSLPDPSR